MSLQPVRPVIEMQIDGTWVDVTANPKIRQSSADSGGGVTITRGRPNEGNTAEPTQLSFTINNAGGQFSPNNPLSPYFGLLGRNTPVRCGIEQRVDTFIGRTASNGWGVSSDGTITWVPMTITPASLAVASGVATFQAASGLRGAISDAQYGDVDVRATIKVSTRDSEFGVVGRCNASTVTPYYYSVYVTPGTTDVMRIGIRSPSGTLSFSVNMSANVIVGTYYKFHMQITGNRVRGSVWLASAGEPGWMNTIFDGGYVARDVPPAGGGVGVICQNGTALLTVDDFAAINWRAHAEITELPPRWDLSQTDKWVPINARGILRRLGQGRKALKSATTRHLSTYPTSAMWLPLEEPGTATRAGSGVDAGKDGVIGGLTWGNDTDDVPGIAGYANFGTAGAFLTVSGKKQANTTAWTHLMFLQVPALPAADFPIASITTTGTVRTWLLTMQLDGALRTDGFGGDGGKTIITTNTTSFYFSGLPVGSWVALALYVYTNGSNVNWVVNFHQPGGTLFYTTGITAVAGKPGNYKATYIKTTAAAEAAGGFKISHLFHYPGDLPFVSYAFAKAANAYIGELAALRFARLCDESGIRRSWVGSDSAITEAMGPQRPKKLLELLEECAESGDAILQEERGEFGLSMIYHASMYNQKPVTLNINSGHLSDPLEPNTDDQGTRNDVTVTSPLGGSARSVATSGPLNTNDPEDDPDGVGTYDEAPELNLATTRQLQPAANWRRSKGTDPRDRYPSLHVDFTSAAYLASPALAAAVGSLDASLPVLIVNPQVSPDAAYQQIQSYTEAFDEYDRDITFVATPADTWTVGVVENTTARGGQTRAGTDYMQVQTAFVAGTGTTLKTQRTDATKHLWVLPADSPASFPFKIKAAGVILNVTSISGTSDPQTLTVDQVPVNGVIKTIPVGSPVTVVDAWRLAW